MEEYPSPAEGIGLENRQGLNGPRGSNPSSSAIRILNPRLIDIKGKYSLYNEYLPFYLPFLYITTLRWS